ncbi:MAG: MerR family transcriptional regulator [Bryobacterales bacterium]|nr:MerR family transcriptional regulator [Bryobacterales bacterium]
MGEQGGLSRKGASANSVSGRSASSAGAPTEIPDKLVFRIGEVSRIVGVEPYVLRYWETEFSQLAPKKSGTGHRMYRRREVEQLLLIRQLLYDRQYTIKGARQYLKELSHRRPGSEEMPSGEASPVVPVASGAAEWTTREQANGALGSGRRPVTMDGLRKELRSILTLLE